MYIGNEIKVYGQKKENGGGLQPVPELPLLKIISSLCL
jgi:hypothetical protein